MNKKQGLVLRGISLIACAAIVLGAFLISTYTIQRSAEVDTQLHSIRY